MPHLISKMRHFFYIKSMKKITLLSSILSLSMGVFAQEALPIKGDEIFGSMRARHIGPALMSGRITEIEGHPTNNKVLFAGAAGGGVWKNW